jgi:alkaline phosphatase
MSLAYGHRFLQPLLGLFAPEDFAAPLDRPSSQPSLEQMVDKAIALLSAATEKSDKHKGFFLFYESEVTDSAGHNNDAIATYSAALEINDAALKVKEWYGKLKQKGEETLFFSTSDHETGGFSIGLDVEDPPTEVEYGWERKFSSWKRKVDDLRALTDPDNWFQL